MFLDIDSNLVEKVSNDNMKNLSMEEKKKLQMLAKRPMKQLKLELDGLMVSKSADSGTGSQERSRTKDQEALNGGADCTGDVTETQDCPGRVFFLTY